MGPPSGGRQVISARTQSRFNLVNLTFPSDAQVTGVGMGVGVMIIMMTMMML
jgi:hypothetical protein